MKLRPHLHEYITHLSLDINIVSYLPPDIKRDARFQQEAVASSAAFLSSILLHLESITLFVTLSERHLHSFMTERYRKYITGVHLLPAAERFDVYYGLEVMVIEEERAAERSEAYRKAEKALEMLLIPETSFEQVDKTQLLTGDVRMTQKALDFETTPSLGWLAIEGDNGVTTYESGTFFLLQ